MSQTKKVKIIKRAEIEKREELQRRQELSLLKILIEKRPKEAKEILREVVVK